MEIGLARVPFTKSVTDVVRLLIPILHSEAFSPPSERKTNFKVKLDYPEEGMIIEHKGTGVVIVPNEIVYKFLEWVKNNPIKPDKGSPTLKFYIKGPARSALDQIITKTPFIDPDREDERRQILWHLNKDLRLTAVQFGILFRERYPSNDKERLGPRSFSIEWEHDAIAQSAAYLRVVFEHKSIRVTIEDSGTESTGKSISIPFDSIERIGMGYDPNPYVCFDTLAPPKFLDYDIFFDHTDKKQSQYHRRVGSVHPGHARIAPYAYQLRIVLFNGGMDDILHTFKNLCDACHNAKLSAAIIYCKPPNNIEARKFGFFTPNRIYKLKKEIFKFSQLSWGVAFQLEALLHNGLLHTGDIESLLPKVRRLCGLYPDNNNQYVALFLRRYAEQLRVRPARESPSQCFDKTRGKYARLDSKLPKGNFMCSHVIFTPSRILLEGPLPTQSNRVIREYEGFEEHFVRVNFSEEDRLAYRWERDADLNTLLEERVGTILKNGFDLTGRHFEYLAYSSSALRNHSFWFINPFEHSSKGFARPGKEKRLVNAEFIRETIGDFKGTKLLRCPSKYAARLGQAFTATDPSVRISREEFEEVPDIGEGDYLHTDGIGTISKSLADEIWAQLEKPGSNVVKPSAYQIRFMGYKGIVGVDEKLDEDGKGIRMRLRDSMKKFENSEEKMPEIEIAEAFIRPKKCNLNRPLIMILEDLGVKRENFEKLQDEAVHDARTIHNSVQHFREILERHSMGRQYRLSYTLKRLKENYGLDLHPQNGGNGMDTKFLQQVRKVAMFSVLRDIKHGARIPVPESHLLVGVADEGPAYEKNGYQDVLTLKEGQIYACIQESPDAEPKCLRGPCTISRSPVVHPGDVQRVDAIGELPEGKLSLFAHMKNVVVLPSVGKRSLASMLGGGDLDGDLFSVIPYSPLLPMTWEGPAKYPKEDPFDLGRDSRVEDICDFIMEYIVSDILGLLSDRLLIIADQSKEGIFDPGCLKLARLCSKAVDYPKNGNPVLRDKKEMPRTLMKEKPDWHSAEAGTPNPVDYYDSDRALGHLFRAIKLETPDELEASTFNDRTDPGHPLTDDISLALEHVVRFWVGQELDDESTDDETKDLFSKYENELSYICSTHTVSIKRNTRLQEAEVVVGCIVDKCMNNRYRRERQYAMQNHTSALVKDIERQFVDNDKSKVPSREEWRKGLERAWKAWDFSQRHDDWGTSSFGLIALGTILDCLDKLGG